MPRFFCDCEYTYTLYHLPLHELTAHRLWCLLDPWLSSWETAAYSWLEASWGFQAALSEVLRSIHAAAAAANTDGRWWLPLHAGRHLLLSLGYQMQVMQQMGQLGGTYPQPQLPGQPAGLPGYPGFPAAAVAPGQPPLGPGQMPPPPMFRPPPSMPPPAQQPPQIP